MNVGEGGAFQPSTPVTPHLPTPCTTFHPPYHTHTHTGYSRILQISPDWGYWDRLLQVWDMVDFAFGGKAWRNHTGRRVKSTSLFLLYSFLTNSNLPGGEKVFKNPPGINHLGMMWSPSTFPHFHYLIIIIVPDVSIHSFIILEAKHLMWGRVQEVCPWEWVASEVRRTKLLQIRSKEALARWVIYFITEFTSCRMMSGLGVRNLRPSSKWGRKYEMSNDESDRRQWHSWQKPQEESFQGFRSLSEGGGLIVKWSKTSRDTDPILNTDMKDSR